MTDRECTRTIATISDYTNVSPLKDVTHRDEARRWSYARPTAPVRTFRRTIAHVWSGSLDRYSIRVVVFVVCHALSATVRRAPRAQSIPTPGPPERQAHETTQKHVIPSTGPIFSLAGRAGSKVSFLARLCPPPDVGNPWCEACRMRLRAEVSQASRVGLAGRMLGDAQQACCKRARGLTVFGAGGAGMREGRSLYTWLPVHSCRDAVPLRPFSSDCCASDLSIG